MRLNAGYTASRFIPSFIVLHTTLIVLIATTVASNMAPGNLQGTSFRQVHEGYTGLLALFAQAKLTQDMSLMTSAGQWAAVLGELIV